MTKNYRQLTRRRALQFGAAAAGAVAWEAPGPAAVAGADPRQEGGWARERSFAQGAGPGRGPLRRR